MSVRINKYLSESGYCSRREADRLITAGSVRINGRLAEMGSQVDAGQVVEVHGERISNDVKPIVIAYNKPVGVVSTTDPNERNNMVDSIGHDERIFPIGRLDKDSQGLILLTNEGDIVNKILRVNNNHDKEYTVTVNRPITKEFVVRMQNGIPILGVVTRKCEITPKGEYVFNMVLRQGLNRQIRRMCEFLGYTVVKLQRIRVMHIELGELRTGQWRNLTEEELVVLYKKIESSVKTEEASKTKSPKPKPTFKRPSSSSKQQPNSTSTKRGAQSSTKRTSTAAAGRTGRSKRNS